MVPVLIIVAVLSGLLGLLFASNATIGVAIVGFACLLAMLARIAQAARHHAVLTARRAADDIHEP